MIDNTKRKGLSKRGGWLLAILGAVLGSTAIMHGMQRGLELNEAAIGAWLPFLFLLIGIYYTRVFQGTNKPTESMSSGNSASVDVRDSQMSSRVEYGGFWRRFAAMWLDIIIMCPLIFLTFWGNSVSRFFEAYYFIPGLVISAIYSIYLVKRFGGTPGKLIMGLRITKVDGSPVGYREAVLRELPNYIFYIALSIGLVIAAFRMTDTEYFSLAWNERRSGLKVLTPAFYSLVETAQIIWVWSEFIVLLTNEKKRAIHDFIAGTVVVVKEPNRSEERTEHAAQPPLLT